MKYWARWVAVLPGSVLAGVLMTIPLHLVLYSTLSNFIDPVPELPERVLTPLVIGATIVWSGARIAPARKMETAVVLFGLWMLLLGGSVALTLFAVNIQGRRLFFQGGGLAPVMAFAGGLVGLLIARKQAKAGISQHVTAEPRS
jgi:hypothetical protein